jgi:dihydropteroate synthase
MGVLNCTPDSFSDGGAFLDVAAAVRHALAMAEEGAAIIDVGAESTRPGASRVPAAEQCRRLHEVLIALRRALPPEVGISVDTTRAAVAELAIAAGAGLLNDISAGRDDPALLPLAARAGLSVCLMHMQGEPATMQAAPHYADVVAEVADFLLARAAAAVAAGVARERILLDPGIGFGKTRAHNLALLAALPRLADLGYPLLLGASRKRFLGSLCHETDPAALVGATCATTALGVAAGVRIFRVHDVRANRQALEVAEALRQAGLSWVSAPAPASVPAASDR